MCVFHIAGRCRNAENCNYAHTPDELSDPKTYLCDGSCNDILECPFAHSDYDHKQLPQRKVALCRFHMQGEPKFLFFLFFEY